MPLPFPSQSRGVVAFGFFNIELEMLLLERSFFFAEDFCRAAGELASATAPIATAPLPGWRIDDPTRVGNLQGAIAGTDLSGFIGATYARHPFPADPACFKQAPSGSMGRGEASELIAAYGTETAFDLVWRREAREVGVAGIWFDEAGFGELIAYVARGGWPRWRDEVRPPYVRRLLAVLGERDPPFRPARAPPS